MSNGHSRPWWERLETAIGGALAGLAPPHYRYHALRQPSDVFPNAPRSTEELLRSEADRIAWRGNLAMESVGFWAQQAAAVLGGLVGGAGEVAGAAARFEQLLLPALASARPVINRAVASVGPALTPRSTAAGLMAARDEAVRIVERLAAQDAHLGQTAMTATERGEVIDAVWKALVRQGIEDGSLPRDIRLAPPPARLTGVPPPRQPLPDAWQPSGIAYDVTTATMRQVAAHDIRYIGRTMPDGTVIRDVLPLVYTRSRPVVPAPPIPRVLQPAVPTSPGLSAADQAVRRSQQQAIELSRRAMEQARQQAAEFARRSSQQAMERATRASQEAAKRAFERSQAQAHEATLRAMNMASQNAARTAPSIAQMDMDRMRRTQQQVIQSRQPLGPVRQISPGVPLLPTADFGRRPIQIGTLQNPAATYIITPRKPVVEIIHNPLFPGLARRPVF